MYVIGRRATLCGFIACIASPLLSLAQESYGNEPIKLIVPFPPGGGTDTVSRLMADNVRAGTGWNFVIENKAGAAGSIGMGELAKAKADGYTVGMGQTADLAINPALYPKMPYDARRGFVPIAVVARQPVALVVRADAPYKTLAELVAAAKSQPRHLMMASAGNGTVGHLTGELFAKQAGFQQVHVPYKGAGAATTDLLGGQVTFYFGTPEAVSPFVKAGKLRALAISSSKRLPVLPDMPTIAESGYKGFKTGDWKMLVAPAGIPADVVNRLNAEVNKALSKPETIARLLTVGSLPGAGTPHEAAQLLAREQARWATVVRAANVKID